MRRKKTRYFLCVETEGYAASLQVRTVYRSFADAEAEAHGMLRIVDESGEDYLFPARFFVPIEVPAAATRALDPSA